MKKILAWTGLLIAVLWLVKNPAGAAADIRQAARALSALVGSL
ncbi:MAG TPA: hypothetical protein VLW44_03810 [Streptosporangiaceae bacterium]|nr:hypothetical protein [Streptosporangiaceae bacterium]